LDNNGRVSDEENDDTQEENASLADALHDGCQALEWECDLM
jgi:hypothetical protein